MANGSVPSINILIARRSGVTAPGWTRFEFRPPPGAVRLSVGDARALGDAALARIGYGADDACIITDQLIDNALCGYRFAGLPRILAIAREARKGRSLRNHSLSRAEPRVRIHLPPAQSPCKPARRAARG